MKNYKPLMLCLSFCCTHFLSGATHNLRQISSRDGLSNSAVFCLYQDTDRFLWIGTFDGLNRYDGKNIRIYKPDINNQHSLSSNVIRNIAETENKYLWISTKWGLNKLSRETNRIEEYYHEFKEDIFLTKDNRDNLYVLARKGMLSMYDNTQKKFLDLPVNKDIIYNNVKSILVDTNDTIWINHKGVLEKYTVSADTAGNPRITRHADYQHPHRIAYMSKSRERLLFIDSAGGLYSINPRRTVFIKNIGSIIRENGSVSSMIYDDTDILIAFSTNGLVKLYAQKNYRAEKTDINCGVFSLLKDEEQDIIWIGTDGQGVFAWTKDDYTFRNLMLTQLPVKKQRPVRAISTDKHNNLWLGTKDNGIIRIHNYPLLNDFTSDDISHYTTQNGLLNDNVFALLPGKFHDVLWIGSDGPGINYYSYQDSKIHPLSQPVSTQITYVHSLIESNDSILWAGAGNTLVKVWIQKQGRKLTAKNTQRFSFELKNNQQFNQIYSLYQESDSCIWIGIRGNGLIQFNPQTEEYRILTFDESGVAPMNDILCIYQDRHKTLWLGTSYGLIRFTIYPDGNYDYKNYNENDGLSNNTIHGILEAPDGKLWLSSNTGIILFDPEIETFRNYNHKTGLRITEFCDNAYHTDHSGTVSFFGGVDGLIWIRQQEAEKKRFVPQIKFTRLRIFNQDYNIYDFLKEDADGNYIRLKHNQNFFAISFAAMDFINGANSIYAYRLENFNEIWMNTHTNEAQFTNIPPGRYTLQVTYNDGSGNYEDRTGSIRIHISHPWYLTVTAQVIYFILILSVIFLVFFFIRNKYEKRKAEMNRRMVQKYKEEMYEGKLRFFTNITHEFSTPLTLIYGPCERILANENNDAKTKKYAGIIRSNTVRLNALIEEIIDFRRMETGNKICHIATTDVSTLTTDIVMSFNELAEQNHIRFQSNIAPQIHWNTDSSAYTKILNNLISNAFKYTPPQGEITINMETTEQELILKVYNTGKGIEKNDIPLIFNRYSVLDNVKENHIKGLSSRNGLGLAICHSMTKMLGGTIQIESEINKFACFIVRLPFAEAGQGKGKPAHSHTIKLPVREKTPDLSEELQPNNNAMLQDEKKSNILIIDDNPELRWMLTDILGSEYNITTAADGEEGLEIMKKKTPDLIITDIMMPNMDGITLTRKIKENQYTTHIPLVILSAKNANEEKIEGIESGADVYIPKPFDTAYLCTVIRTLLKNKKNLEAYYNSPASAFDYSRGELIKVEDKEFLENAIHIVTNNIDNPDFSPEELASAMQISIRNLYRKFKELKQNPPNDFIKEQRLNRSAKLIRTTGLTIQEIMYSTGFNNRSHFNREFMKRFGKTPKEYREANR